MRYAIGLMSGTSMDGVDAALIETDGRTIRVVLGPNGHAEIAGATHAFPYAPEETALLARAKEEARRGLPLRDGRPDRSARPGALGEAEAFLTDIHARAVEALLAHANVSASDIAVLGFHGQTVLHRPEERLTVQIGDGAELAARLGIPVVHDLRAADVAAGGQGAPLVPVFHRALAEASGLVPPLAVLNIGGVANVTLIGEGEDDLAGFDTGPGNALLNDLMMERRGEPFDRDGATAGRGRVDEVLLGWMLTHPYFDRPPPKSLDRDAFSHRMVATLRLEDAAATLTAFTARSVAGALAWSPVRPRRWIVGGGGAENTTLMRMLAEALGPDVDLADADAYGWSSAFLEAQAFAYLAARSIAGLPLTYRGTTGVSEPTQGGVIAQP